MLRILQILRIWFIKKHALDGAWIFFIKDYFISFNRLKSSEVHWAWDLMMLFRVLRRKVPPEW